MAEGGRRQDWEQAVRSKENVGGRVAEGGRGEDWEENMRRKGRMGE